MADPEAPYNWRVDASGGAGAIADIGSHIIGMARFLLGPISHVDADLETVVKSRPIAAGSSERRASKSMILRALTVRFERGCRGTIEANWAATGRKMQLGFELTGAKGSLSIRKNASMNCCIIAPAAIHVIAVTPVSRQGLPIIPQGCSASRRATNLASTISRQSSCRIFGSDCWGERRGPDFREAWEIQKIIDTAVRSSKSRTWQAIE